MSHRIDWYAHEVPAVVRRKRLRRHRALLDHDRACAVILLAQGPPRAWHLGLDAAVRGVTTALEDGETRAEPILAAAAARVRAYAGALVDDSPIQVHGISLSLSGTSLSVATAGSCRAYLQRHNKHSRLTSSSDAKGLQKAFTFSTKTHAIERDDIVVLGPSHIFGVTGVAQMAKLLQSRSTLTARALARGLLSTSETEQTGGAVIALRVM
jgi:hypothetical protein